LVCRLTYLIGVEVRGIDSESGVSISDDEAPICQNLIVLSSDVETRVRGEEKKKVVVWSLKISRKPYILSSYLLRV